VVADTIKALCCDLKDSRWVIVNHCRPWLQYTRLEMPACVRTRFPPPGEIKAITAHSMPAILPFLPPEILTHVFWWTMKPMESRYDRSYYAVNRDTLLETSRAWHAAGLADPNLWTDLFVNNTTYSNMDRLHTYVRCAGRLPIHVVMVLYVEDNSPGLLPYDPLHPWTTL
jgi:hypothetical protein